MSYQPQQWCPACGAPIPNDVDATTGECRRCRGKL